MENHELKTDTENLLDDVLHRLTAQDSPPALWQVSCFLDSLDGIRRGSYRLAWNRALDVMATNVAEDPFQDQGVTAKQLDGITIEMLRGGLKAIKWLPVSKGIDFGPLEVISDWVRKQDR